MAVARYAILDSSDNVQSFVLWDGTTPFSAGAGLRLVAAPDGWGEVDGKLAQLPAPSAPAPAPRYVPLATIRDRVTALGKWAAFAAALDSLPSDKRWHLLTLTEGVAPDDPDAIALLTACGCDPAVVLAP